MTSNNAGITRRMALAGVLALWSQARADSSPIAVWGDSLTPRLATQLRSLSGRFVFDGGVSGNTSAQVLARQQETPSMRDWTTVFWFGRNGYGDLEGVKTDMAAAIGLLDSGNRRFSVLSILNSAHPHESIGEPGYKAITRLNADLAARYPEHFIDVRAALVKSRNPFSPQDLLDAHNDVVPTSMRYDHLHLNDKGSRIVAQLVLDFINAKGW